VIFIDTKESATSGMQKIMKLLQEEGREYQMIPLQAGDVIVQGQTKAYIIEIKRGNDLVSSINTERMWEELMKLKNVKIEGKKAREVIPTILFEGDIRILNWRYGGSYIKNGQKKTKYLFRSTGEIKSEMARIHSILHTWKIPIMHTADEYQTAIYLSWLDEAIDREKKEKTIHITLDIPKELPPERMAIELLGAIVGGKTAIAILKKCNSLYEVAYRAKFEGEKAFENIRYDDGRRIPKNLIERLVKVFKAEVKIQ
jgi:ERCC4-type nuclease